MVTTEQITLLESLGFHQMVENENDGRVWHYREYWLIHSYTITQLVQYGFRFEVSFSADGICIILKKS